MFYIDAGQGRKIHQQSLQPANDTLGSRCSEAVWSNGAVCMFLASLSLASSAFFVCLLHDRIRVFQIIAIRSFCSLLLSVTSILHMQRNDPDLRIFGQPCSFGKLCFRGLAGTAGLSLYYISIKNLSLGDAVAIHFTNAIVTPILSSLAGFDVPKWAIAATCLSFAGGLGVMFVPSFVSGSEGAGHILGAATGVGSSLAVVLALVNIRSLAGSEPAAVMAVWFHMVSGITSIIPMLLGIPEPVVLPTLGEWLVLGGLIVTSLMGQIFLSRGFSLLSLPKAAAINLLQVVHARVLGTIFLHDPLEVTSIGGSVLVAIGVLFAHMGRDGVRFRERPSRPELDLDLALLAGSDNAPLLSPDVSVESDDSPVATTPVCIPVAELNAAQCRSEGGLCRAFVPAMEVGHDSM